MQQQDRSNPRQPGKRQRFDPPVILDAEPLEYVEILSEVPDPLGLALWQTARDVSLWAMARDPVNVLFAADSQRRRMHFLASLPVERDPVPSLRVLSSVLDSHEAVTAESLSAECQRIVLWAEARRAVATALAYAQVSALLVPQSPGAAYAVGRLARRRGEYARAETWLYRAVVIGRRTGDWVAYTRALMGLGNLSRLRGDLPSAKRHHLRALHVARRRSLHQLAGEALHDLFCVVGELGPSEAALEYAREAFETYGPRHVKLPALACDLGYFWLLHGRFACALRVLQAVFPVLPDADRLIAAGTLARAAGGAGDKEAFEQAWDEAALRLRENRASAGEASVLLDLARGAASLGAWERAEAAARQAQLTATRLGEQQTCFEAEAVLESIRRERAFQESQLGAGPDPVTSEDLSWRLAAALAGASR